MNRHHRSLPGYGLNRARMTAAGGLLTLMLTLLPLTAQAQAPTGRASDDSCPAGIPDAQYPDVKADNPHSHAVNCVVWWRIARGVSAERYQPAGRISRAQMATFIAALIERSGGSFPGSTRNHFSDDNGNIHETNINRLADAGIIGGVGGGRYNPSGNVSRAQMATFLIAAYQYRTQAELPAAADQYSDDQGNVHESNINKAASIGVTGGESGASYRPDDRVRRDEMASFVAELLDKLVEDDGVERPAAPETRLTVSGEGLHPTGDRCCAWDDEPGSINGSFFERTLSATIYSVDSAGGNNRSLEFNLGRDYGIFETTVGQRDDAEYADSTVVFRVYGDSQVLAEHTLAFGESADLDLDVTGVLRLRLEMVNLHQNHRAQAAFGNPVVLPF